MWMSDRKPDQHYAEVNEYVWHMIKILYGSNYEIKYSKEKRAITIVSLQENNLFSEESLVKNLKTQNIQ